MTRKLLLTVCFAFAMVGAAFGSCSAPQNQIEAENCNPGTNGWEVSGLGDLTIQGFSTDISVNTGQTIYFKISTPATSYHVDLYRLGYYGGTGGRYVTTIQPSAKLPQNQPACLADPSTQLYDCAIGECQRPGRYQRMLYPVSTSLRLCVMTPAAPAR